MNSQASTLYSLAVRNKFPKIAQSVLDHNLSKMSRSKYRDVRNAIIYNNPGKALGILSNYPLSKAGKGNL